MVLEEGGSALTRGWSFGGDADAHRARRACALATRDIGLDTHVADIVGLLESEDLRDVVLVGHSYGGMVVTAVAERAAQRISGLYLDAFLPDAGKALGDYAPIPATRADGWRVPPLPPSAWGVAGTMR